MKDEVEIIDVNEELSTKHKEVREKIGKKKHFGMSSKRGREIAIQAATMFKPSGPSFMSILKPYNIRFYSLVSLFIHSVILKLFKFCLAINIYMLIVATLVFCEVCAS